MRISTKSDPRETVALATVQAAVEAGITVFDTAHAYGRGEDEPGHNERLLARALRLQGVAPSPRIVTKGGMSRPGGAWVPDGRARAIRADCEASLLALDGLSIDLYLLHAPDPRTPWRTSVRALARLAEEGLVRHVGVSNVNRDQLDQALDLAPLAAVQVALNPFDDRAIRGGLLARCEERGLALLAHSPLGGPRRASRLTRLPGLAEVARSRAATPAEIALAWVLDLAPNVVAVAGARRPETARSAARAGRIRLSEAEELTLLGALGGRRTTPAATVPLLDEGEVVLLMGIPGAGKSRAAADLVERGYARLNRDERGGSLRQLDAELEGRLRAGERRVVLDNTYLTRASRSEVVATAARHGLPARCVWFDTPLAQAQVNLVERLLDRFGRLPSPEELQAAARREPGLMRPTSQMRALRELEPPTEDEGFASLERVPFTRAAPPDRHGAGVLVSARALDRPGSETALAALEPTRPHLVIDWRPGKPDEALAPLAGRVSAVVTGPVETAVCPHPGGPPGCWCRPPLPGLPLAFARAHLLDPARLTVVGANATHRTLARAIGARYVVP